MIACDMAGMGCSQWHAIDVSDGRVASIDELLDRAVAAINRGDRVAPSALADQVLAVDGGNAEADDLLTPGDAGEIRRLTILFADLVDSTVSGHGHRIDDQHRRVPVVGVFSRANAYRAR